METLTPLPDPEAPREQLLLLDAKLRIRAASPSFYEAFQFLPGQTIGKDLVEAGHGQWNIPDLLKLFKNLPATEGESQNIEVEYDTPPLGRSSLLLTAQRLAGDDAENGMFLLRIRDITQQKRSAREAGELLSQLQVSLASIGYGLIVTDPETRIKVMNSTAETLTGWSQNDARQQRLTDVFKIVSEQSAATLDSPVKSVLRERAVIDLEKYMVLVARNGCAAPIGGNAAQILDASGSLAGTVLVFNDISLRRKAEQAIEISELRYRRLFESAHDGILILDALTAKVLDVNPFLTDLLGYPKEHFMGKELWEIGVFRDAETSKKAMATLQEEGQIRYEDLPLQHKDGRHIPVEFVSNVYPEGKRNVIQCNIRDITQRKRLADDLAQATRKAEAASRAKSEFLANMSHEIRTPMGAILGFAEMLLHRSAEECAQIGCVQIIQRNSMHLLELINEILDLSKVEAGQMKVERVSCQLPELLSELISVMRPRAAEKGLAFGIRFDGPIPRLIQTDPMRLRQILVNLVGNAVKFTEFGRIDLCIADQGAGGPEILLRVDVVDSGIGMTTEQLERLFKPFTQADASVTRKFGGTGLGLTISRQLAKLLEGDVTATSQPGIGSTFTMTVNGGPSAGVEQLRNLTEEGLPVAADREARVAIKLSGRILLVEDGADNQRLLQMVLGDAGASVVSALDGQVALDLANIYTFDLILMDMQMPVMDGYAATRELRRRGATIPIIALTAYAMAEDREKCLACGCTAFLTKPIQEETLLRTVSEHLGNGHLPASEDGAGNSIESSHAGNPRIMQIVPEFVAGLPGKVGQMMNLLERNDLPELQNLAHQLLGSCSGYGFAAVSEPARRLQQSIKAGQPVDSTAAATQSLIELIRRIDGYDRSKETAAVEELVR